MNKTTYHHGDLEAALLEAGMREARTSGAHNLGLTHLAKLVRVTPTAVYRHFSSGESLKAAIAQRAREELARRMQVAIAQEDDVKCRFLAVGRSYIEFAFGEPNLFAVAFITCEESPSREDNPSSWMILHDAILDLCNAGLITTTEVEEVATFAWSIVHGYAILAGGTDPMRPGAKNADIENVLERAWLAITQYP